MASTLEAQVRQLRIAVALLAACLFLLVASGFVGPRGKQSFGEINVERLNIVEKSGKLDMVISNQERQHPGISNGKLIHRNGPRPPGIIFFDQSGDEMGGLIYGPNGGKGHFGSFTFDKVGADQTIGFRHLEGDSGTYSTALEMWQQVPGGGNAPERLFLGKQRDDSVLLTLADVQGRPRINMRVQPDGTPRLEFLDERGAIVYTVPPPKT